MAKGLPASGKSTWAEEQVLKAPAGQAVRVNRDLIRIMLHADRWKGQKTEGITVSVRDTVILLAMQRRVPLIISDDTNLAPSVEKDLRDLAAAGGYEFLIKDFTDVPIKTCIERDLKRLRSVGEKVIKRMARDFLSPPLLPIPPYDPELPDAVIFDVDGTLAKMGDRGPFDWAKVGIDTPIVSIVRLADTFRQQGYRIIFMSGRDAICRPETLAWLNEHAIRHPDELLFMRPIKDQRQDSIVKEEIYRAEILGKYNVEWVVDDRNQVVEMWRDLGLTCLQVAEGDF